MPPRRPYKTLGTGHAPTAGIRGPGDRPRPHFSHTRHRGPGTPLRRPYGARKPYTPPRRPYKPQGSNHAPLAAIRGPGDRPLPSGGYARLGDRPQTHAGHTWRRGPATLSRRPCRPRGTATPQRRPYRAQGTGHAPTTAIRGQGDRPRPHGGQTGSRNPAMFPQQPYWAHGTATPPRRRYGAQVTGHTPTVAIRGPGDRPRHHGGHTGSREPATLFYLVLVQGGTVGTYY